MVADRVEVLSRKAGEEEGWRWISDGKGSFTIEPAPNVPRGARITLHMREGDEEYLEPHRIRQIVKTYSDHIALPIVLGRRQQGRDDQHRLGAVDPAARRDHRRAVQGVLPPCRPRLRRAVADPARPAPRARSNTPTCCSCRRRSRSICSIPNARPRLKLYVRRVFITDEGTELLPAYLRFMRGIVDSEDLPLNISREMLQSNPMVARIRQQLTRRVLSELAKKATEAADEYAKFWDNFGAVLKEGLYEDREQRDTLLGARPLPLDGARRPRLARRLCRGDAAGAGGDLYDHRRQSRSVAEKPAARRIPRPRRRGPAADRPDRRILGAGDRHLQGKAVQIGDPRRRSISTRSRRPTTQRRPPTSPSRRPSSPA